MRLVEAGKLDLDATVQSYLPDFRLADADASAKATLRHLLTHTGGWVGDFFHDTGNGDDALTRYVADMADLKQLAPLGALWSYNNAGFGVAGAIIEKVTGRPYEEVLHDLVLAPLGLAHSYLYSGDVMVHRFAVGHALNGDAPQVAAPWVLPRYVYPVGALVCRAEDLLQYARFHLGDGLTLDGERLLTAESVAAMQTPQVTVWDKESWGLTWSINDTYGARLVGHGGGTKGQVSRLTLVPQHDFALVIFTNADQGGQVVQTVLQAALQSYLGVDAAPPKPLNAQPDELVGFVGRYGRPFSEIELGMLGGRLTAQMIYKGGFPTEDVSAPPPPPPLTLDLCAPDRLIAVNGPMKDALVDVIRQPDGSIGWLRAGGRLHRKGE